MENGKVEIIELEQVSLHCHDTELIFLYVLEGTMNYQVSFEEHRMIKGDYTLINAGEFHALRALEEASCIVAVITVNIDWLRGYFPYSGYTLLVCDVFQLEQEGLVAEHRVEKLREMLLHLAEDYFYHGGMEDESLLRIFEFMNQAFTLSDYILEEHSESAMREKKTQIYNELYKLIVENYRRKDCIQFITGRLYYSPEYLNKIFRSFVGSSLQEGINNIRCWESERALIMTEDSIVDIAEAHGFSDSKYYYKYFKRWYGMTPKQFRRKCREVLKCPDSYTIWKGEDALRYLQHTLGSGGGRAGYITTHSGIHFYPLEPRPEDIRIEDIAHALSLICRGNGHVKHFFSVAQHCLNCAAEAEARGYGRRVCLASLLHDAAEAYLSDVPSPFKQSMPAYRELEQKLLGMIYQKYLGSPLTEAEAVLVKAVDGDMLYFDLRELLNESPDRSEPEMKSIFSEEFVPFGEVEQRYLEIFRKLSG